MPVAESRIRFAGPVRSALKFAALTVPRVRCLRLRCDGSVTCFAREPVVSLAQMTVVAVTDCGVPSMRQWVRRNPAVLLLVCCFSACASFTVADTAPPPPSALAAPGDDHISRDGYRLDALSPSRDTPDLLVLVAMSGGGKRSASFAYGALKGHAQGDCADRRGAYAFIAGG